jgi:hypothetical protein
MLGNFWNGYMFQLDQNPVFERIEPQVSLGQKYNYAGAFKDQWAEPGVWFRFKQQTYLWQSYLWSSEVFAGTRVDGISRWHGDIDTEFSKLAQFGVDWRYGNSLIRDRDNPRLGDEFSYGAWLQLKATSQFLVYLEYRNFNIAELDGGPEVYDTFVSRARVTYQFSKRLFLRMVGEYVDDSRQFSLDPLLSYKINPFTVFFIGSSHSFNQFEDDPQTAEIEINNNGYRQTDRLFFLKFQYLIRM